MSEFYDQNNQQNPGTYSNTPDKSAANPIVIGASVKPEQTTQDAQVNREVPNTVPQNNIQQNNIPQNNVQQNNVQQNNVQSDQKYYAPQYNQTSQNVPYRNPYYFNGGNQPSYPSQNPQNVYAPATGKSKAKKSGRGTILAVSVICVIAVLLSGLAGIGGAMLVNSRSGNADSPDINTHLTQVNGSDKESSSYTEDDAGVIYKSVNSVIQSTNGTATIADVAAAVKDSVVEITTEYQNTSYFQYVTQGAGSGVVITSDGYIVTNNHVVTDASTGALADSITVRLTNGDEYDAEVIGYDSASDIALLKIDAVNLTPAVLGDSDKLVVGEEVVVVGNPLGELGGTVTNGIISALDREIEVDGTTMNLLQTNAAVNPGNSGGGLFNMNGELVGVVNAKSSGTGIEGLGFAIPSNDANSIIEQLLEYGYVRGRVYLGLRYIDIEDYFTAMSYRVNSLGVYVVEAYEGYNDGVLKSGDRITAIDGTEISTSSDIKNVLTGHEVGDKLTFTIARDGKITDVTVECFELIPDTAETVNFN